jgi:hypothetical protein
VIALDAADGAALIHEVVTAVIVTIAAPAVGIPYMGAEIVAECAVAVFVVAVFAGFRSHGEHGEAAQQHTAYQQQAQNFTKH